MDKLLKSEKESLFPPTLVQDPNSLILTRRALPHTTPLSINTSPCKCSLLAKTVKFASIFSFLTFKQSIRGGGWGGGINITRAF